MSIVNPRLEVVEKLVTSHFAERVGKDSFFLTLDDAVMATQYSLHKSKKNVDTTV